MKRGEFPVHLYTMNVHKYIYMNFDYFLCNNCNVTVEENELDDHKGCEFLGEFFEVKKIRRKKFNGMIPKKLVNKAKEKINEEKFEKKVMIEKKKKVLAQKRFEQQIPVNDVIVNLLELDLK